MKSWKIKNLLFLTCFFNLAIASAQAYYPLHPSIGDTLDRVEKLDYSLFPEVSNKELQYCLITFEEGNYLLNSYYTASDKAQQLVLTQAMVVEAQQNIEKVNAYYALKAREDSTKTEKTDLYPNKPTGKAPVLLNGPMNEQAKKEARMIQRLREDRRRMEERQRGFGNNQLHIEFR